MPRAKGKGVFQATSLETREIPISMSQLLTVTNGIIVVLKQ